MNNMSNTEQSKIIERLEFLSDCVTKGRDSIDRNFHMSIPARPLEDADLVLSTAACLIRDSGNEIAKLREEYDTNYGEAKRICKEICHSLGHKAESPLFCDMQSEVESLRNKLKKFQAESELLTEAQTNLINIAKSLLQDSEGNAGEDDPLDDLISQLLKYQRSKKDAAEKASGVGTVSFSIDGWRCNLSRTLELLSKEVQGLINEDYYFDDSKEVLIEYINELICSSNSFNCVSIPMVEDFSPMGDIEIQLLNYPE